MKERPTRTLGRGLRLEAIAATLGLLVAACGDDGGSDGGGADVALPTCLDFEAIYALVGPESIGFANWSDATALADELGSEYGADLPSAPLDVTGPGEESGTYDTFVEFIVEDYEEERGLGEEEIATRPDYVSSPNDNVIIEGISGSASSFGWVGYAFFVENQDAVSAFEIADPESGECVAPTDETIADGTYPLSRDLFIYVNKDKAAENDALASFVDHYVGDVGLEKAAEAGYVQLTDEDWAATGEAWTSEGTAGSGGGDLSGDIVVSGSSTVEPITSLVAEDFSAENSGVGISVDGPGTGDGFELFCNGETDISDASRPIKDEEAEVCADNGVEYVELRVAIDGLTVMTSA